MVRSRRRRGCSYFGCRILRHVRTDMQKLARHGFDYVVHTVSEHDLAYYEGSLRDIFAATHDAGLEVHADPWGVGRLFGGEAFSDLLARSPELRQVDSRGRPLPAACPARPEVAAWLERWIAVVAAAGADGLFIDEPHLHLGRGPAAGGGERPPETWSCRCDSCRRRFEAETGASMPTTRTPEVEAFRRRLVVELTRRLAAGGGRAGLRTVLCVLPAEIGGPNALPIEEASTIREIDVLSTDPYWIHAGLEPESFVGACAGRLGELARRTGKDAQLWIQGFRIPAGREQEIHLAVDAARRAGIDDLAVWGFEACGSMSYLRPDDPEKAWAAILSALAAD